tara:strand:- start:1302 stop:1757 length:456 start_codon:yes stop_codon:yes gene_type:complete
MNFSLKRIQYSDWKILLDWRNDDNTRHQFFDSSVIDESAHKTYIKNITNNPRIEEIDQQYILYVNDEPAGTIKSSKISNGEYFLSYTISNKFRGKNLSVIMMQLFLYDMKGIFICEIKNTNLASIKMVERVGYELLTTDNNILTYKLIKKL